MSSPVLRKAPRSNGHLFRLQTNMFRKSLEPRALSTSAVIRNKSHKDAMRRYLQRFGYHLANVNPIRPDGLLTEPSCVRRCIPSSMAPLLEVLTHKRLEENSSSSAKLQSSFSKILQDQLFKAEHISIHDNDAATLEVLINSYCNHIGYEFDHCNTEAERNFFVSAIEDPQKALSKEGFILFEDDWIFEQLYRTELFERLMHERYSNARTFGIEGMETASLAINVIAETFAQQAGNQSPSKVILGTTHRGRINFLANCLKLPWTELMASWCETNGPTYDDICLPNHRSLSLNQNCQLVLLPIPAHLEAMVPGLLGYARAYASQQAGDGICRGDSLATNMVLPLSLHGDSSFCGEGIIQETLQLGTCQHYQCGGTIHIILNNQIGYTTELSSIKSGSFKPIQSSDIAKSIGAPVLHVNANQPRAVVQACQIAVLYRQKFGADVVIDVVGWRKLGHNELDDPTMTSPQLYETIRGLVPVTTAFEQELISGGNSEQVMRVKEELNVMYHAAKHFKGGEEPHTHYACQLEDDGTGIWSGTSHLGQTTSISKDLLQKAGKALVAHPDSFTFHPIVEKTINTRRKSLESDDGKVDWATAELLALSSLATEGIPVRLSGEDSERGTFTQRHAVWHDATTGKEYHAMPNQMEIANSPLSELSVVGFEFGWSLWNPNSLVCWEAQFGDFADEAQVIFDTMISSSVSRWGIESNIVLLLPHGYDGMGPDHSSCRPERWLQMFASEIPVDPNDPMSVYKACNFIVACPTEPANYFHLLRRQLTWPFRRPLVVLSPKRTLRNPRATSPISAFVSDGIQDYFSCVIDDPFWDEKKGQAKGVLLCSGEIYYDLVKIREQNEGLSDVAFVRLEQLAPFPAKELNRVVASYPNIKACAWAQEEPANNGAATFLRDQLFYKETVQGLHMLPLTWISRPESASAASGDPQKHSQSQQQLLRTIVEWSNLLE